MGWTRCDRISPQRLSESEALDAAVERANAEREDLILEALDAGLPATEVAALAGVTPQRVRMLARRRRVPASR